MSFHAFRDTSNCSCPCLLIIKEPGCRRPKRLARRAAAAFFSSDRRGFALFSGIKVEAPEQISMLLPLPEPGK
jgi:hypothetical protein